MAFDPKNLALLSHGNGFCHYRYDTTETLATVDGNGFINNNDDGTKLRVGDIVDVVVWATAVRTGTVSDIGKMIVMQVAANGDVDLSGDLTSWTPATGD